MENNIRIIGIDLDGTLLQKDKSVSEQNKIAIRHCLDKGIQVYLVTGRPFCFTKMIAQQIDTRVQLIAANGGIYEIGNRCTETAIEVSTLHEIILILKKYQMCAFLKGKHTIYTHESYDKRFLYDHMNENFDIGNKTRSCTEMMWQELIDHAHGILKILVYHEDENKLVQARTEIGCIENCEITDYQKISFDITAKRINKGNIVRRILEENGYTKENFMAIGDGNNDIAMFQEAGISVAMENATNDVKQYCDYVTAHYLDEGVSKALQHFIKES